MYDQLLLILGAGIGFSMVFTTVSYLINRHLCQGRLDFTGGEIALSAALVFVVAVACEAVVNPIYEYYFNAKLWEYRLLPLHDGNVSALGMLVWMTYGVHLYFLNQSLERKLPAGRRRLLYKAIIIGSEAPLVWEVLGNLYFLAVVDEFYAYYLPDDLFHLTSFRVVPIYIGCVYIGLIVHAALLKHAPYWRTAGALTLGGAVFLAMGG